MKQMLTRPSRQKQKTVETRTGPGGERRRIVRGGTGTTTASAEGDIDPGAALGIASAATDIDIVPVPVRATDGDTMTRTTDAGIARGAGSTGDETTTLSAVGNELQVMSVHDHVRGTAAAVETREAGHHTSQSRPETIEGKRRSSSKYCLRHGKGTRMARPHVGLCLTCFSAWQEEKSQLHHLA
jgi:hypothetical protein